MNGPDEDVVQHHAGCRADYPEKAPGEPPQWLTVLALDDGDEVLQCVDCGAFVVRPAGVGTLRGAGGGRGGARRSCRSAKLYNRGEEGTDR